MDLFFGREKREIADVERRAVLQFLILISLTSLTKRKSRCVMRIGNERSYSKLSITV